MHAPNGFHVVANDSGARVTNSLNCFFIAAKIANKNLNTHVGTRRPSKVNCFGPQLGATIRQLIAIDTGDDHVFKIH